MRGDSPRSRRYDYVTCQLIYCGLATVIDAGNLDRLLTRNWNVGLGSILLKNSIRVSPATILGVSNYHLTDLRRSERVLEGRILRPPLMQSLHGSFSTE
jgi:hypothetical protein